MKFSCTSKKLIHAVLIAERFVGKNITLPVLSNILFEVVKNTMKVTATNLEHAAETLVLGSGSGDGSIALPAKIVSSFMQSLKEDTVDLEERQGSILIKTLLRDTKINGVSAQDFPLVPKVDNNKEFFISAQELSGGIGLVLPAVSQSDFKPELNGVLFKVNPSHIRLAATDTFRLAEKKVSFAKSYNGTSFSFILPSHTAMEVARALDDGGNVRVVVDDNQVMCECEDLCITSRVIEGNFPDYIDIIPKNYETSCRMARQDMHDAIRASSIFASKLQDVSLNFQGKSVEVASANNEIGEYKTKANAFIEGKNLQLRFNYRYLLDGLNMLHSDEILFGGNTEQSPVVLRNKDDNSFLYVVMPIRSV